MFREERTKTVLQRISRTHWGGVNSNCSSIRIGCSGSCRELNFTELENLRLKRSVANPWRIRVFASAIFLAIHIVCTSVSQGHDEPSDQPKSNGTVNDPWADHDRIFLGRRKVVPGESDKLIRLERLRENEDYGLELAIATNSKKTFHIGKVHTSCGCVVGVPEDREISPGESIVIRVLIAPKLGSKQFSQSLLVLDLDGHAIYKSRLVADVTTIFDLASDRLTLSDGTKRRVLVTLRSNTAPPASSLYVRLPTIDRSWKSISLLKGVNQEVAFNVSESLGSMPQWTDTVQLSLDRKSLFYELPVIIWQHGAYEFRPRRLVVTGGGTESKHTLALIGSFDANTDQNLKFVITNDTGSWPIKFDSMPFEQGLILTFAIPNFIEISAGTRVWAKMHDKEIASLPCIGNYRRVR